MVAKELINADTVLLIISPHPDDETIGCAGLINRVKKAGGRVFLQIMTYGDEEQYGGFSEKSTRMQELEAVVDFLQIDDYEIFFPGEKYHLKLDALPEKELLDYIEKRGRLSLNNINPTMVGLPAPNSHNVDHQVTYRAAFTALRPRPHNLKSFTPVVFVYDNFNLWNHEPFRANWFLNIENELDDKIHALSLYQSQMRAEPHERSLENLRRYHEVLGRGVGVSAVEQFELLRLFTE